MPQGCNLLDRARIMADDHGLPGCPSLCEGHATEASPDTQIGDQPALRLDDPGAHLTCEGAQLWRAVQGSATVEINGRPAVRKGDATLHCGGLGAMIDGEAEVVIGGPATPLSPEVLLELAEIRARADLIRANFEELKERMPDQYEAILEAWENAQPWERELLIDLMERGASLADVLSGAHYLIEDRGELLCKWRGYEGAYERTSSHSDVQSNEFAINGTELLPTVLFGSNISEMGSAGDTRLQAEGAPWSVTSPAEDWIDHGADFVEYILTGENQGPWGSSENVDTKPVLLPEGPEEGEPP